MADFRIVYVWDDAQRRFIPKTSLPTVRDTAVEKLADIPSVPWRVVPEGFNTRMFGSWPRGVGESWRV